jgi:hypothetical protein
MRARTRWADFQPSSPHDAGDAGEPPSPLAFLSVVILFDGRARHLERLLAAASTLLAPRVAEHEVIVIANGLDERASTALQRLGVAATETERRVFLLTQRVDAYTAAWRGIENARGRWVAVLDSATDDITYLPELLRRAAAGADIVFARGTDRTPPRLSRAIARRLVDTVQRSLGVTSVENAAPRYRVLHPRVVSFIAQHPDPVAAYRRLPSGTSFTQAHLQYSSKSQAAPPPKPLQRAARATRRLISSALDTATSLQGYDTRFHDPADGDGTICLLKIPVLRSGTFEIPQQLLDRDSGPYHPMNPTIARLGEQTWVNVRMVNYRKQGHGSTVSGDGVYRSRNLVLEWNALAGLAGVPREVDGVPARWAQDTRVRGLEDQRWVVHQGRLWFSACCCQVPHEEGGSKMVLGRMNETLDAVDHLVPLRYDAARVAEKNWLLWSIGGKLLAIYGYHPFTLLDLDTETGRALPHRVHRAEFPARRLRGSAGPLPLSERPGHWLVLVHEVARRFDRPVYAHRWLLVHADIGMVAQSRPFLFDHAGIEYAAGLLANADGTLTVTYGFEDREARWAVLDRQSVLASLHAVRQQPEAPSDTSASERPRAPLSRVSAS